MYMHIYMYIWIVDTTSYSLKYVQHYPSVDVMILIRSAHQMWENDILEDLRANEKKEAAGNSRRTSIAAGVCNPRRILLLE